MIRHFRRWFAVSTQSKPQRRCGRWQLQHLENRLAPAVFTVTSLADTLTPGTLRQAVADANGNGAGIDTINFNIPAGGTIVLASEIAITGSVVIDGPSAFNITVDGNNATRLFNVDNGSAIIDVTIDQLTLTKGKATGDGGAIRNANENLSILNCQVINNSASDDGGAVFVDSNGSLILFNSTVSGNTAASNGGGIYFFDGGSVDFLDCVISNNNATSDGGGFYFYGPVASGGFNLANVTISGNTASQKGAGVYIVNGSGSFNFDRCTVANNTATNDGGGFWVEGGVYNLTNTTISGNKGLDGGGLYLTGGINGSALRNVTIANNMSTNNAAGLFVANATGTLNVTNATISGNVASGSNAGGMSTYGGNPTVNLESSIISGNTAPSAADFGRYAGTLNVTSSAFQTTVGGFNDLGGNIVGPHANLKLGALANNGGLTQTMRPAFDSPLINAGSNPGGLTTDQRGFTRASGTTDIGAVEYQTNAVVLNNNNAGDGSLRQAIIGTNLDSGAGTITFDPTFFASAKTIALTSGEIAINEALTVFGLGADKVIVSGNNASRIFNTSAAASGTIMNFRALRLTGGSSNGDGGALFADDQILNFTDCVINANTTTTDGGAIAFGTTSVGALNLLRCTVSGNTATSSSSDGGAIYFYYGGSFSFQASTFSGNKASGTISDGGGALYFFGTATTALIAQSTFTGNEGSNGGAIQLQNFTGTLSVVNSTITGNTAKTGNAGGIIRQSGLGTITLDSTIVAGNDATANANDDLFTTGTVTANFSAIGTKTGVTTFNGDATTNALMGQNFKLGMLANNGGPTQTILPAADSPVRDNGNNSAMLTVDQRGLPRIWNGQADIGAAELDPLFIVRNDNDAGKDSLRQQVLDANAMAGANTITFDAVAFAATDDTITLTTGEIAITDSLTVTGLGADKVVVSGNNASRIFNSVGAGPTLQAKLSGVTLANGKSTSSGGAIVASQEQWFLSDCVLTNNHSTGSLGGAIAFGGAAAAATSLTIDRCTVTGNTSAGGGGIAMVGGGSLKVLNSTLTNNSTTFANSGGAIRFGGTIGVDGCIFRNSTFTGNSSGLNGGAVGFPAVTGTPIFQNCTITGNTASAGSTGGAGGGIGVNLGGTILLESSIVAGNKLGAGATSTALDLLANVVTANFSAIGTSAGAATFNGDATTNALLGQDFKLGVLTDNGGPTLTIRPAVDSPVRDNGSNPAMLTIDQRGLPRIWNGQADIGAMELDPLFVVRNDNDAGKDSLRQQVLDANAFAGANTITFGTEFAATDDTITLTSTLLISSDVTIAGPGADKATVSGNNLVQVMAIDGPTNLNVALSGLTITAGKTSLRGGGIRINDEFVTLDAMAIRGNSTTDDGGGIALGDNGKLTVTNSEISGNAANEDGGGIFTSYLVQVIIRNTTLSGNSAGVRGGAFSGLVWLPSCSFLMQNSTVTNNTAVLAGGGFRTQGGGADLNIECSVISGNIGPAGSPDIFTGKVNLTNSLVGSLSGFTLATNVNNLMPGTPAKLGPLDNYGGTTRTHLPAIDSPLRDNGSNPAMLTIDQRGLPRTWNGQTDIGAVELDPLFVVRNDNDSGKDSLRQQVLDANAMAGANTITFGAEFAATDDTITLTSGEILVTSSVTITGPGAKLAMVSGNNDSRVFNINIPSFGMVAMSDLTIANGSASNGGAFLLQDDFLNLTAMSIRNNQATSTDGGGIHVQNGGTVTVKNSTLANNSAGWGGAISLYQNGGSAFIENSTLSGNVATNNGGGIYFRGTSGYGITVLNSTITANSASNGGGIYRDSGPAVILQSSIVSGNTGGFSTDIFSAVPVVSTFSAVGSNAGFPSLSGPNNLAFGADLKLGVLADNGGPTQTHALLPGSAALNKGSNTLMFANDQRGPGFLREVGQADIGAFEVQAQSAKVTNVEVNGGAMQRSMVTSIRVTFDSTVILPMNPADAFQLKRNSDSAAVILSAVQMGGDVTLTFTGGAVDGTSLADGLYTLTILAAQVNNGGLDGDGNGTPGDDYVLVGNSAMAPKLYRLFGDSDGNGTVTAADFNAFRLAYGTMGASIFDFDGNNQVTAADFNAFRLRYGTMI